MSPNDFKAWRVTMGMSQAAAAEALGVSRVTIQNYERGSTSDGRPQTVPLAIALACSALFHRLEPWGGE